MKSKEIPASIASWSWHLYTWSSIGYHFWLSCIVGSFIQSAIDDHRHLLLAPTPVSKSEQFSMVLIDKKNCHENHYETVYLLIPSHDSPNGYPTVRPAELHSVTLSHQVDSHKTLTTHKLACSCFVALFGHQ